jgi:hypothetical protein
VQGMRTDLRRILRSGGRVRVVVLDPTDEALVAVAAARSPESPEALRRRVLMTLDVLSTIRAEVDDRLEIRVASHILVAGMNALDLDGPRGMITVQHYEFQPGAEPAPIFSLEAREGEWYRHFVAEAERIWDRSTPWPLTPAQELSRARTAGFAETFGPDLDRFMDLSQNMFITGIVRNAFVHSRYRVLENYLKSGRSVRVLLIDPESPGMQQAVDHYNVDRSVAGARARVENTLRILSQLHHTTGGDLTVRLTANPLPVGIIATDCLPVQGEPVSVVFAQYYTYRAASVSKFALRADDPWRRHFVDEAEALWADAKPYEFTVD